MPTHNERAGSSVREADTTWVVAAAALTAALTVAVVVVPPLHSAQRSLTAHVAIESAACVIAGLMAAIAAMRLRRTHAVADLLLMATLLLLAVTNLSFSLLPALAGDADDAIGTWASVVGRLLGSLGFLGAAFAGTRTVADARRALRLAVFGTMGVLLVVAIVMAALESSLPRPVDVVGAGADRPDLEGPPVIVGTHLAQVIIYALAAWGFARHRQAGPGFTWIAVAMIVAAGARVNYLLYPTLYSEYVHAGDVLRLGSYLVLFGAMVGQIVGYERAMAELGVLRERRRIARDLHDGLAQELAFITAQSARLSATDPATTGAIARSAERALLESRMAISALMREGAEPLPEALARVAQDAARGKAEVEVSAVDEALPPATREALLRIVAEAAANAVRHGGASRLEIGFENGDGLHLRVADDGSGFDPAVPTASGRYGLESMRDRAQGLGGTLRIDSAPGEGTRVEVHVP